VLVREALHGVGLAGACLTICENGRMETIGDLTNEVRQSHLVAHLLLRALGPEHRIEGEAPRLFGNCLRLVTHPTSIVLKWWRQHGDGAYPSTFRLQQAAAVSLNFLPSKQRPNTDANLHGRQWHRLGGLLSFVLLQNCP